MAGGSRQSQEVDPGVSLLDCMLKYEVTDPKDQLIGNGSYGNVYKGVWKNQDIALKVAFNNDASNGVPDSTIREVFLLKSFDHPNIIKLLNVEHDKNHVCFALEYMEFDLHKFMKKHPEKMTTDRIKMFMQHLLSAIEYCHEEKIMHRDLKPDNLLIDGEGTTLKLTDFGQARTCADSREKYSGQIQTMGYKAPEILLGSTSYSYEIDMWSIGCIFAEMVSGNALFERDVKDNMERHLVSIFRVRGTPDENSWPGVTSFKTFNSTEVHKPQDLSEILPGLDRDGVDLLSKLLWLNPLERISASQALRHPYLKLSGGQADSNA